DSDLRDLSVDSLNREAEDIRIQLPANQGTSQLILILNELGQLSNVTLEQIDIVNETTPSDQRYYPNDVSILRHHIDFSADSFADFEVFITQFNDFERIIEIDQLTFQQRTIDGVSGTVIFRTFYSDAVTID